MEDLLPTLIQSIPSSALPLVVVIIGCFYIYKKIGKEREETKAVRDKDTLQIREDIIGLKFKVSNIEGRTVHHEEILDDLRNQIAILNTNIVKLSTIIERMNNVKQ